MWPHVPKWLSESVLRNLYVVPRSNSEERKVFYSNMSTIYVVKYRKWLYIPVKERDIRNIDCYDKRSMSTGYYRMFTPLILH